MNLLVYITVPERVMADYMARELVEARLAAGVHIAGPIRSVYRWQGEIRNAEEWTLLAQCAGGVFEDIRDFVLARHPYITPCIVAWNIDHGYKPFMDWIERAGE